MRHSHSSHSSRQSVCAALLLALLSQPSFAYERTIGFEAVNVPLDSVTLAPGNRLYATHTSNAHLGFFFDRDSGALLSARTFELGLLSSVESRPARAVNTITLSANSGFDPAFGNFRPAANYFAQYDFGTLDAKPTLEIQANEEILPLPDGVIYATGSTLEFAPSISDRQNWQVQLASAPRCLVADGTDAVALLLSNNGQTVWQRRSIASGALLSAITLLAPPSSAVNTNTSCPQASGTSLYALIDKLTSFSQPSRMTGRFDLKTGALLAVKELPRSSFYTKLLSVDGELPIYTTCQSESPSYATPALLSDLFRAISPLSSIVRGEDGLIIALSCNIVALDSALNQLWSSAIAGGVAQITLVSPQLLLAQTNESVTLLDRQSGVQRWEVDLNMDQRVQISAQDGKLYWLESSGARDEGSVLRVLDPNSRAQLSAVSLNAKSNATRTIAGAFDGGRWWLAGNAPNRALTLDSFSAGAPGYSTELAAGGRLVQKLAVGSGRVAVALVDDASSIRIVDSANGRIQAQFRLPADFVYGTHVFSDSGALFVVGTDRCEEFLPCASAQVWRWDLGAAQPIKMPPESFASVYPAPRAVDLGGSTEGQSYAIAVGNDLITMLRSFGVEGTTVDYSIQRWSPETQSVAWKLDIAASPFAYPPQVLETPELNAADLLAILVSHPDGSSIQLVRLSTGEALRSISTPFPARARDLKFVPLSDARIAMMSHQYGSTNAPAGMILSVFAPEGRTLQLERSFPGTVDFESLRMAQAPDTQNSAAGSIAQSRLILSYPRLGTDASFKPTSDLNLLWLDTETFSPLAEQVIARQDLDAYTPGLELLGLGGSKLGAETLHSGGNAYAARKTTLKSTAFPQDKLIGNLSVTVAPAGMQFAASQVGFDIANEGAAPQQVKLTLFQPGQLLRCEVLFVNAKPPGTSASTPSVCPTAVPGEVLLPAQSKIRLTFSASNMLAIQPAAPGGVEPNAQDNVVISRSPLLR